MNIIPGFPPNSIGSKLCGNEGHSVVDIEQMITQCHSVRSVFCYLIDSAALRRLIFNVGSQLSDFFKSPEKIRRFGNDQLDACTYCPNGLKTKNQRLS